MIEQETGDKWDIVWFKGYLGRSLTLNREYNRYITIEYYEK